MLESWAGQSILQPQAFSYVFAVTGIFHMGGTCVTQVKTYGQTQHYHMCSTRWMPLPLLCIS